MAKVPGRIGYGEGGKELPKLAQLLNDIAEDLKTLFAEAEIPDNQRKHTASYEED